MAKRLKLCEVHSFSTSSNSCHHTTVLNANVPSCYTTLLLLVLDCSHLHYQFDKRRYVIWFNKFMGLNILHRKQQAIEHFNPFSPLRGIFPWSRKCDATENVKLQMRLHIFCGVGDYSTCIRVRGAHFEHKFWQFWTELLYELIILLNKPHFTLLCAN